MPFVTHLTSATVSGLVMGPAVANLFNTYDMVEPAKKSAQIKILSTKLMADLRQNKVQFADWNHWFKFLLNAERQDAVEGDYVEIKQLVCAFIAPSTCQNMLEHRRILLTPASVFKTVLL